MGTTGEREGIVISRDTWRASKGADNSLFLDMSGGYMSIHFIISIIILHIATYYI